MAAVFRIKRVFSFEEVMEATASPPEHQDLAISPTFPGSPWEEEVFVEMPPFSFLLGIPNN